MPTHKFYKIKVTAFRTRDGKRQQKTFWQTLSPFNRDANGAPKSASEIRAELQAEAKAWAEGD